MPRPATSMESHSSEEDLPAQGKRKGMLPLPSISSSFQSSNGYSTLQLKKLRAPHSMHSLRSLHSTDNMRDVSVSTAMSMLRIDEEKRRASTEHQAISTTMKPLRTPSLRNKPSITTGLRNLRIDSTESALVLFQAPGDSLVAPKTPSQIPVLCKAEALPATPATPCKTPKTSPHKIPYLTKDSNIPAFTAWDVRGRLEDMEAMYSELKDKFSGTNIERNGLEEAVGLFKARSKLYSVLYRGT
jgi:kinesin family protein C1